MSPSEELVTLEIVLINCSGRWLKRGRLQKLHKVFSDYLQSWSPWVTIYGKYLLMLLNCLIGVKGVRVPRNGMGSPLECTVCCIFRLKVSVKQRRQNLVAEMEHLLKQRD